MALFLHARKKCCYCERKRNQKRESDVEHFRPKAEVAEAPGHPGYWWMAYDWENYLFSCKTCNQDYKKNRFPLLKESQRALGPGTHRERPVLIDPATEDPTGFIGYVWESDRVIAIGLDEDGRGDRTVNELTAINQEDVIDERSNGLGNLELIAGLMKRALAGNHSELIAKYAGEIERETDSALPFAGFRRFYFRKRGLAEFMARA